MSTEASAEWRAAIERERAELVEICRELSPRGAPDLDESSSIIYLRERARILREDHDERCRRDELREQARLFIARHERVIREEQEAVAFAAGALCNFLPRWRRARQRSAALP